MSEISGLAAPAAAPLSGVAAKQKATSLPRGHGSARLAAKRAGMVVFSSYPADPRPRRAAEALRQATEEARAAAEGSRQIAGEIQDGLREMIKEFHSQKSLRN